MNLTNNYCCDNQSKLSQNNSNNTKSICNNSSNFNIGSILNYNIYEFSNKNNNKSSSNYFKNNFNLEDYSFSNLNKYQVEKKNIYKSSIGKNSEYNSIKPNSLNKLNFFNHNNKHSVNNSLNMMSPLGCSLTIKKLDTPTPPQNKYQKRALNAKVIYNNESLVHANHSIKPSFNYNNVNGIKDSNVYLSSSNSRNNNGNENYSYNAPGDFNNKNKSYTQQDRVENESGKQYNITIEELIKDKGLAGNNFLAELSEESEEDLK